MLGISSKESVRRTSFSHTVGGFRKTTRCEEGDRDEMNYTIMCTVKEIGLTNEGKVRCELAPVSKYRLKVENKELYVAINSGSCEVLVVDPKNLRGEVVGDMGEILVALYGSGREVSIIVGADGKVSWLGS